MPTLWTGRNSIENFLLSAHTVIDQTKVSGHIDILDTLNEVKIVGMFFNTRYTSRLKLKINNKPYIFVTYLKETAMPLITLLGGVYEEEQQ